MIESLARYGARAAVASGISSIVGTLFLIAFFVVEAPAIIGSGDTERWVPLGRTNDALIGITALMAIPVASRVHAAWRLRAPTASAVAFAIAMLALTATGVTQLLYAANLISSAVQTVIVGPLLAGTGVWLLAVNLGRAIEPLRGGLRGVGVGTGLGYVLLLATTVAYATSGSSDPSVAFSNPLFGTSAGLGFVGAYVGYPIWSIWLGRRLGREDAATGG